MINGTTTAYASDLANIVERTYNLTSTKNTENAFQTIEGSSEARTVEHSYDNYTIKGSTVGETAYDYTLFSTTDTFYIPTITDGNYPNYTSTSINSFSSTNRTEFVDITGTSSTIIGGYTSVTGTGSTVDGFFAGGTQETTIGTAVTSTDDSGSTKDLHVNYPYVVTETTNVLRDDTDTYLQATTIPGISANTGGTYTTEINYTATSTSVSVQTISETTFWTISNYTATSDNVVNVPADVVNIGVWIANDDEWFYYVNPLSYAIGSPVDGSEAFSLITDKTTYVKLDNVGLDAYRTNLPVANIPKFTTYTTSTVLSNFSYSNQPITAKDYEISGGITQSTRGLNSGLDYETYDHSYSYTVETDVPWTKFIQDFNVDSYDISFDTFSYSVIGAPVTYDASEASSVGFFLDSVISASSFGSGDTFTASTTIQDMETAMSHTGFNSLVTHHGQTVDAGGTYTYGSDVTISGIAGGESISYYANTFRYDVYPSGVKRLIGNAAAKRTYERDQGVIPSTDMSYSNSWGLSITSPSIYSDFISFSMSQPFGQVYYPNAYTLTKETISYTTTVDTDTVNVTETLTVATVSQSIDSVSVTTYTSNTSTTSTGSGTFTFGYALPWGSTYIADAIHDLTNASFVVNPFQDGDPVTITLAGFANVTTFDSLGNNLATSTYNTTKTVLSIDSGEGMVIDKGGVSSYFVMNSYSKAGSPVYPEEKIITWM